MFNTSDDGYKYHMFYNLKDYYEISDFKPSIFAKKYFDLIFSAAGYTYEWSGMTGTTFDKMIIPFNSDKPLNDTTDLEFLAGFSAQTDYFPSPNSTGSGTGLGYSNVSGYGLNFTKWWRKHNKIIFDDDSTLPFNDNFGVYDNSTGIYTSNYYGINTFEGKYKYKVYLRSVNNLTLKVPNQFVGGGQHPTPQYIPGWARYKLSHYFNKNSSYISIGDGTGSVPTAFVSKDYFMGDTLAAGDTLIAEGYTDFSYTTEVDFGDTFFYNINTLINYDSTPGWEINGGGGALEIPQIIIKLGTDLPDTLNNFFQDVPSKAVFGEGRNLKMNNYIPKNIKWKDYISSIVKLFNLYLTPSKERDKHIIIQTRDEFYDSGITLDWSDKIDLSNDHKIQFLPDLQDKNLLLSYKKAEDIWNTQYEAGTGEIYGQALYTFENQFVQSIKKIEPIFEPTPLNETFSGGGRNIVSTIDSQFPKTGLRILYDGGWIPNTYSGNTWVYKTPVGSITATTYASEYPYAGHLYPVPGPQSVEPDNT